jgi:GTP-binding protein HflX
MAIAQIITKRALTLVMFEQSRHSEATILVHIYFSRDEGTDALEEFCELARAAGGTVKAVITGTREVPEAKYYIGKGKAEEIRNAVQSLSAELVIFNHALSPAQERNLEQLLKCRVIDRTGLILDIFAQRARTFEGKLQVELAQLEHLATRLVRGWTHLERQRGGIGLRGPGETQLEVDRRLIRRRIKTIDKRLEKVKQQRAQSRRARHRSELKTAAVVGYTNAGKSTLFNRLSHAEVYVADQPFATLDPTLRRVALPNKMSVILADTVGFIRDLPHDLVEAFHATLEETQMADLLLHIVDAHTQGKKERIAQVNDVLQQIGAEQVPQLLVYNKIDLLPDHEARIDRNAENKPWRVWISAVTGEGIDLLQQALMELLQQDIVYYHLRLAPTEGRLRSTLYALNAIEQETIDEEGHWLLDLKLTKADYERLFNSEKII